MRKMRQGQLTPDDWAEAALRAIGRGGVGAVAVEPIAAELGATKGSFYWHFKNRDALVVAALDRWEERSTELVIADLERDSDPARRLRRIIGAALARGPSDRAEIALLANPDHPAALRAVRRVAERRITYMAEQLETLGWDSREALDRAALLYYVYLGFLHMAHVAPHLIGADPRTRHLELLFDALVSIGLAQVPGDTTRRRSGTPPAGLSHRP